MKQKLPNTVFIDIYLGIFVTKLKFWRVVLTLNKTLKIRENNKNIPLGFQFKVAPGFHMQVRFFPFLTLLLPLPIKHEHSHRATL